MTKKENIEIYDFIFLSRIPIIILVYIIYYINLSIKERKQRLKPLYLLYKML